MNRDVVCCTFSVIYSEEQKKKKNCVSAGRNHLLQMVQCAKMLQYETEKEKNNT